MMRLDESDRFELDVKPTSLKRNKLNIYGVSGYLTFGVDGKSISDVITTKCSKILHTSSIVGLSRGLSDHESASLIFRETFWGTSKQKKANITINFKYMVSTSVCGGQTYGR